MSKFIDPQISFEPAGRKKVRTFRLDDTSDLAEYEELMNNREIFTIIKESHTTDRNGRMLITVWWAEIAD